MKSNNLRKIINEEVQKVLSEMHTKEPDIDLLKDVLQNALDGAPLRAYVSTPSGYVPLDDHFYDVVYFKPYHGYVVTPNGKGVEVLKAHGEDVENL